MATTRKAPRNVLVGDCRERLRDLPDASVDSIVTDPPYELGFMGKKWDASGVAYDVGLWRECLRVLKPGGHLLAFGGTRTYHRMAVAIEDAGFEIRDSLHWVYSTGFPKSLNVGKALEAQAKTGSSSPKAQRKAAMGADYEPTPLAGTPGYGTTGNFAKKDTGSKPLAVTDDDAKQWAGFGTALKPAHEPIVVARKPLVGTVAANVLAHGTGALNIDGSRVGGDGGRWPSNLLFTHAAGCGDGCVSLDDVIDALGFDRSQLEAELDAGDGCAEGCPVAELDGQSGGASRFFTVTEWDPIADVAPFRYVAKPSKRERNAGLDGLPEKQAQKWNSGGIAARRAETAQPVANVHPTVKPVALMRWLVRLVTPEGGTVLDPFLGSGTTAVAAELEGFKWLGCEMTADYLPIIEGRVKWAQAERKAGRADKPRYKAPTAKAAKPAPEPDGDGEQLELPAA
jgi:DNA modification methylase